VTSALGYLDLKQICYCLAQALLKHIEFSRGHIFLDELQLEHSETDIEFSYMQGELKIDLEVAKEKKKEKEEQARVEFEKLKAQMGQSEKLTSIGGAKPPAV